MARQPVPLLAPGLLAPQPVEPVRQFSFTDFQVNNPASPPPGDRLDGEFDRTNVVLGDTIAWAATSLNTDGTLRPGIVGKQQFVPGLFDDIADDAVALLQPMVEQAGSYTTQAFNAGWAASAAAALSEASASRADQKASDAAIFTERGERAAKGAEDDARSTSSDADRAENAANHADGSEAVAQAYADVGMAWAEHMPDTIPPNILAVMGVTGDHWSARWWANKALENVISHTAIEGGVLTGPLYWTATGGNTPRSAQDRAADVINVLDHGADPTGVVDSSPAFASALALRRNGRPVDVYAPTGVYRLNSSITGGHANYAQRLSGDGWSTVLLVGPGFNASALGVIQAVTAAGISKDAQFSVCDMQIMFEQPPDITTATTASSAAGGTTITVASVVGLQTGFYCRNIPNPNSMQFQSRMPRIVSIAGNVITLDQPHVATVNSGDVVSFAGNRSQAVDLSTSPTLTPGAPAIRYPWAIYARSQSLWFDHILVSGAWNGIYIRGQTFAIGQYFVTALNIGLDIDECYNFNKIDHYQMWAGWGFNNSPAMLGIYYDGQLVTANIGRADDFTCDILQSWCGIVNLTSSFTWGGISQLKMDGDNSDFNVLGGSRVHISQFYSSKGFYSVGRPVVVNASVCRVFIGIFQMTSAVTNMASVTVTSGALTINGGYMWDGHIGPDPMISVTGGSLAIDQMRFDSSAGRNIAYLTQTGGSVRVNNSAFVIAPGLGGRAFNLTDDPMNSITDVELNGWLFAAPGTLGRYEADATPGISFTNTSSLFTELDTPTTAQVVVRPPPGVNGAEGKIRWYGSFPTGADTAPRLTASLRSGFSATSWTGSYLNLWLANGTNDVISDANMTRVLNLSLASTTLGYDTADTSFQINGGANLTRRVQLQTASSPRFDLALTGGVETGGNVGSNFRIRRYTDAGGAIDDPISISRATGNVTIAVGANLGGQLGASVSDLSKHLAVHTGGYGINMTSGRMNFLAPTAAAMAFVTGTGDRILVQDAAVTMLVSLVIGATGGPNIRSGTGAATGTQPAGSIWMRTDGATGTRIYVSSGGGTWLPIAGV